ncbi:MAG: family 20 glycosylhydrolase [Clostridia bacterium]|nr:family 20 glycosylhydrolase [Clostridia bacterium]
MNHKILPAPRSAQYGEDMYPLSATYFSDGFAGCEIPVIAAASDSFDRVFARFLTRAASPEEAGIVCICDPALRGGAYAVCADAHGVTLRASDAEGLNYAFASLLLSVEVDGDALTVPGMHIEDKPEGSWRGLMVDLARKWHPIKYLYDAVDLCWLYKINRLQLHFTDDQSFTFPTEAYPRLKTENRWYSRESLRALDDYAKSRGVMLVPELDLPGHCSCFNAAYPEIFGTHGIMCAEEKTFSALQTLIDEIIDVFPDAKYLHLGGDEAAIARWDDCEGCRAYRAEHDLPDVHALYAHYLQRMTDYVLSKHVTPVIWEGFSKAYNHLISKDVIVIAWESYYQLAPDLLAGGFTLINCSWKPLYICTPGKYWTPGEILKWDIFRWQHWWPNSIASKQDIVVPDTSPVLGGQICAWGDQLVGMPSNEEACRTEFALIRERIPALAEKTWNVHSEMTAETLACRFAHTDACLTRLLRK